MRYVGIIILNLLAINHLFAMDMPEQTEQRLDNIQYQLFKQGYVASEDIASYLMIPEEIFKNLNSYVDEKSKKRESLNTIPENLDEHSTVISRSYRILGSHINTIIAQERIYDLENLCLHVKELLPPGSYLFNAFLVSDMSGVAYTEGTIELMWHQDRFNSSTALSQFDLLFFMVLDEYNFGDSHLGLGLVDEAELNRDEEVNTAYTVKEGHFDSVELLAKIKSRKRAGYLIDQRFKNDANKVVVHKSPVLEKKGKASRRYKVILRIKCLTPTPQIQVQHTNFGDIDRRVGYLHTLIVALLYCMINQI